MTDRKKPGVAFWATVVLVLSVLHVVGFGPACWWFSRHRDFHDSRLKDCGSVIYAPLGRVAIHAPIIGDALLWYASLGADDYHGYAVPIGWRRFAVEKM